MGGFSEEATMFGRKSFLPRGIPSTRGLIGGLGPNGWRGWYGWRGAIGPRGGIISNLYNLIDWILWARVPAYLPNTRN